MKLSVFCLLCVLWPSHPEPRHRQGRAQEDYCWPHNTQVCRHFLVSSLYSCHSIGYRFRSDFSDLDTACSILLAKLQKLKKSTLFKVLNLQFSLSSLSSSFHTGRIQNPHFRTSADLDLTWRDCVRVPGRILRSGDTRDPSQYSARSAYRLSQPNGLLWVSSGGYCWVDQSGIDKSSIITRIRKVLLRNYLPHQFKIPRHIFNIMVLNIISFKSIK